MKIVKWILLAIGLLVLGFVAVKGYGIYKVIHTPVEIDHILCEIKHGDTGRDIAARLFDNNIIIDKQLFHIIIRLRKLDRHLKAGQYLFTGNLNMLDTIAKIVSGEIIVNRVTIPEGYSIYRTFRAITEGGIGNYERFLKVARDKDFVREATGFDVETLEGFLYPDTYLFGLDMSEESVIRHMIGNFYNRLDSAHIEIEDKEQFYKDLILASIVEKEAVFNDEKPRIAGVYLNRLKIGMKLQADPTVSYHLEDTFIHRKLITYRMTREETPYNTYVIDGLPPHPICSPAISAIFAVLNPEPTPYYFFFADKTGRHIFTENYSEHLRRQRQNRGE